MRKQKARALRLRRPGSAQTECRSVRGLSASGSSPCCKATLRRDDASRTTAGRAISRRDASGKYSIGSRRRARASPARRRPEKGSRPAVGRGARESQSFFVATGTFIETRAAQPGAPRNQNSVPERAVSTSFDFDRRRSRAQILGAAARCRRGFIACADTRSARPYLRRGSRVRMAA